MDANDTNIDKCEEIRLGMPTATRPVWENEGKFEFFDQILRPKSYVICMYVHVYIFGPNRFEPYIIVQLYIYSKIVSGMIFSVYFNGSKTY